MQNFYLETHTISSNLDIATVESLETGTKRCYNVENVINGFILSAFVQQ